MPPTTADLFPPVCWNGKNVFCINNLFFFLSLFLGPRACSAFSNRCRQCLFTDSKRDIFLGGGVRRSLIFPFFAVSRCRFGCFSLYTSMDIYRRRRRRLLFTYSAILHPDRGEKNAELFDTHTHGKEKEFVREVSRCEHV